LSSLVEAEKAGTLEGRIFVLELGIGVGLFARFFLDAFKELSAREHKDYYRRLTYIAGDRSERMLADACRHGVFANHADRYQLRVVDALEPGRYLGSGDKGPVIRAIFLNYLLDCLPAAHVHFGDVGCVAGGPDGQTGEATPSGPPATRPTGPLRQLCVRTCLARNVDLAEYTHLTPQDIARRAQYPSTANRRSIQELYGLFASEYAYFPADAAGLKHDLPYLDFTRRFAREHGGYLLHSYGAIQSLERLLQLLHPTGFILVNDYGLGKIEKGAEFEHQRFSQATGVGLNFPLLQSYFRDEARAQWLEPAEQNEHIYSRLLGRNIGPETAKMFSERFGKADWERAQAPWQTARGNLPHGRVEAALTAYYQALERQPSNWLLMNEIANFLTFQLRNPVAGIAMAKAALELNPACSAELWNTLGDAYYEAGKIPEAGNAYRRALRVNPDDVKGRYNLVWVLVAQRRYRPALALVAEALALDETGEYYERLVKKQAEILARLNQRNQQRFFLLANRVSSRTGQAPAATDHANGKDTKS
jgi:tetratricopeptide (TPR) repeat protein